MQRGILERFRVLGPAAILLLLSAANALSAPARSTITIQSPTESTAIVGAIALFGAATAKRRVAFVEVSLYHLNSATFWNAGTASWQSAPAKSLAVLTASNTKVTQWSLHVPAPDSRVGDYIAWAQVVDQRQSYGEEDTVSFAVTEPVPPSDLTDCEYPPGGALLLADFADLRSQNFPVTELNQSTPRTFVRTVFGLEDDRMRWGENGIELAVDIGIDGPIDYMYRAELREQRINEPIPAGTTQMYCARFNVESLPDLYGPVKIFQRFNRDYDGSDIGLELTGANQFYDAVANDIQVVTKFDNVRYRTGTQLDEIDTNTLMVVVHNHASRGAFKVVLNGNVLREAYGLNTIGSDDGTWSQFGIYPHGLYENDGDNRQQQIDSGFTYIQLEFLDYKLVNYDEGTDDLSDFAVR